MKLLITGGLGYVGERLAEHAAKLGHQLTLTTRRAVEGARAQARIVRLDPLDADALCAASAGVDAIVHLAGQNAAECARNPEQSIETRRAAAAAVARAARSAGARLVLVSSAHVYGRALAGVVDEETAPDPVHPYGRSHLAAEGELRRASGVEAITVRLTNAFGAPVDPRCDCWTLLTNDLARQAVREGALRLTSSGGQQRDFIAMSEVCRALLHLCTMSGVPADGLVNLGAGESRTLFEQAERVAAAYERARGIRLAVQRGTREDQVGAAPLEVSCARLAASGFERRADADDAELDSLVQFCASTAEAA